MKLLRCCRFIEQILICASFLSISSWCELMGECFSHMFKLKDTRLDSSLSKFVIHRFQSKSPFWIDLHWRRANCLRSIGSGLVGGRTAWKRTRSVSYSAFASIFFSTPTNSMFANFHVFPSPSNFLSDMQRAKTRRCFSTILVFVKFWLSPLFTFVSHLKRGVSNCQFLIKACPAIF